MEQIEVLRIINRYPYIYQSTLRKLLTSSGDIRPILRLYQYGLIKRIKYNRTFKLYITEKGKKFLDEFKPMKV